MLIVVSVAATAQGGEVDPSWQNSYALEAQGRYAEAADAIEALLDSRPPSELALLRTGWLDYLAGDYSAAVSHYKRALELNNRSLEARLGLSLPLMAQQRWREAALTLKQTLEIAPWNYYGHIRLMAVEEATGDWEPLLRHAQSFVERFPSDATGYVYLARAAQRTGDRKRASNAYQKVLERYPGHEEAVAFLSSP